MEPTIRALVDAQARAQPDAPFLLAPETGQVVTYASLRAAARRIEARLDGAGVPAGEPVAFMLPNGLSAALVLLGAMYAGRVVAPQNLLAHERHLAYALEHSGTRLVFASGEHAQRLRRIAGDSGAAFAVMEIDVDGDEFLRDGVLAAEETELDTLAPRSPASRAAGDARVPATSAPALLMYTSGTTGQPKGALLSHANLLAAARAVAESLSLTAQDRVLSSLPFYHVNGQCIATLAPLASGGSVVLPHRFSASQWWTLVERYRPTWINVVPTIIAYLLNGPPLTAEQRVACRTLRFARSASAPLPPATHQAFEARFGVAVIEAMGLTETASVAFTSGLAKDGRRLGSPGRPLGMEARVRRADGHLAADREIGEIDLRAPM